jgi:hypothetical protein
MGGDEYDRDIAALPVELLLQLGAGHARHGDIEYETTGAREAGRSEERFSRVERLRIEPERPQQIGQGLPHRLVVVDNRHQLARKHTQTVLLEGA